MALAPVTSGRRCCSPEPRLSLGLQVLAVVEAVQVHSAPASPREVVLAPAAALDSARLATPSAHRRLQSLWQHFGDFGQGSLWPVPGSTAHSLRFSIKLWHPEQSHTVELLGDTDAKAAAAEVRALAGHSSRTQVFAAAGGMPAGQVHLVAAPRDRSHVTVFFDAGIEVWCVDVPRHTNSEYLLGVACSLASTDALQISSSVSSPLRNGDVLGVRLEVDSVEVDLSEHVLAQPGASATTWLDPVRYFTLLTAASGATTYQLPRSAEVDVHLLKGLVRHVEGPGGTFLELPFGALLRRPIWVHCAPDLDHVVFRVTEAWDPQDNGLFFVFRGTFPTYADFVRSLRQDPSPRAQWLRAIRPFGTTVLSWEYTQLMRPRGFSLWVVHCSADIARAQLHHVRYISRQPPIINLRAPHPWPRAQRRDTDAKAAAAEVRALAGHSSRTQVFAAAGGMPAGQVHLVAAPRDRSHVTVFFDAGIEVWCVDVPRHTNSEYLLGVACSLASTDALQISSSVSSPLRNGDVLGVRLEVDSVEVDLSEHVLAQPGASATTWLDPVRYFTLLTAASGATTYQLPRSAEVDVHLLKGLVRHVEGPGGTFLELPFGALLRRPIWVHCAPDLDHVVFRVTEAWDPQDNGLFFVFRGTFPTYADFVRSLRQDPSPRAQWLRAIRPFGTTVLSWEYTQLMRPRGFSLWVVHCSADIARAQLHHVRYISRQPPIINRYPEIPSALDNLWCSAWQIRCVVPCIPGYLLWAIRDGDRLLGMCTASITWDLVASALHISMWELPQTFLHGEGAVWPYPRDLSTVAHRCVSVSHDTAEAVSCLGQDLPTIPQARSAAHAHGAWPLCLFLASRHAWASLLCAVAPAWAVRLDTHIPSADDAPCVTAMPFQDYRDTTRTCTMSWTLELSRQTHGFAVEPHVLGRYIERLCPGQEVLIQLWSPGRSSVLLQERVRSASRYLEEHLSRLGYVRDVHELCVAFDTSNHALDVILIPHTGGTWWILQDQVGREILRPVMRYYVDAARFRILTVSPEGIGQAVCPSYQVRQSIALASRSSRQSNEGPPGVRGRFPPRDPPHCCSGRRRPPWLVVASCWSALCPSLCRCPLSQF